MNIQKVNFWVFSLFFLLPLPQSKAQTAEAIMELYIKHSGGQDRWEQIQSMQVKGMAKLISQKMELPFERIMDQQGRQIVKLKINGMDYVSIAHDGEQVWGSNQLMEPALKGQDETANTKALVNDFPFPGFNWKERGYQIELMGKAQIKDTETYEIKLTKQPQLVEGEAIENVVHLFFDTQTYLPILSQTVLVSGPQKGKVQQSYLKDYRLIDGCLYPFVTELQYAEESEPFQILITENVEWNLTFEDSVYKMPAQ